MSDRERAEQLLKRVPEYKIKYVLAYLHGMTDGEFEEVDPDEWDLKMIEEAKQYNDGSAVTFEEMLRKDGLTYADL